MPVTKHVDTLYDHYKETCSLITDGVKRRERALLYLIVAAAFFAFQAIFPSVANTAVAGYLNSQYGLPLQINLSTIGNVVWFLVLIFSLRYFQITVFIEKQYAYLHHLEDKLAEAIGDAVITREGKSYLENYPWFSNWMSILYRVILPILLLAIVSAKIFNEWRNASYHLSFGLSLDSVFFMMIAISIILYVLTLHLKPEGTRNPRKLLKIK